jgi:hypothetical protein
MVVNFSRQTIDTIKEPAHMHTNRSVPSRQYRIRQYASNSDAFKFFNLLTSSELLGAMEFNLPVHRERLFPPTETLSMFLAQALKPDRSCQSIVNDSAVKRLMYRLPKCSAKTGGYCRARKRLPLESVMGMARYSGRLIAAKSSDKLLWHGRRVKLIDGTTVTMPDTPANQASYPQQKGQKPGLGFPICRIVGVTCLFSGAVLNAAMGGFKGKGSGEQALLRTLLDTFEPGDLILGDAFYATYFLLAELQARKIDSLFEQHGARKRSTDFSQGEELGSRDHLITLTKPKVRPDWMTAEQYISAPDTLIVRELKVGGKVLVTTLMCPKLIPKVELKDLFKLRWNVELDIRNIKTILGMETLSCKTPAMCEKEMWVYFLGYNLIRLIMAESALLADVLPRTLSFKHTVQLWLAWDGISKPTDELINVGKLLALVSEKSVGNRPGRVEPRAIKRRPKPYPLLMENRTLVREKIKLHGHPKKLK